MAAFSEKLLVTMGARFSGPISILRNWTFCLFYVMAELWGSVVVSLLFWGFANQVCCFPDHLTIILTLSACQVYDGHLPAVRCVAL